MGDEAAKDAVDPADGVPKKATWLPGGEPEPETEAPVQPHDPDKARGERQDGAGVAPPRAERTDRTPADDLPAGGGGAREGGGPDDDPFAAHRGVPENRK